MDIDVLAPFDNTLIKKVSMVDAQEAETTLQRAYQSYLDRDKWLKPYERMAILEKAVAIMSTRVDELALDAATEGGKPLKDSKVEAMRAISGIKAAIAHMQQISGREIPMQISSSSVHRRAFTFREPAGVIFAISAFNHPLNLIVHQVIPAIAVGAPVIVKPAIKTPLSCFKLIDILYEAGLPKNWCQAFICDRTITEKIAGDQRVSFLSFIGSSKVGWYLRSKLAPGANCALEHGGIAPVIVAEDAAFEQMIPLLVKGGLYHAGQVCVSVQRVFVPQKLVKPFLKNLSALVAKQVVGNPREIETDVGPLITTNEVDRVDLWIKQALEQKTQLICGGARISNSCYEPTILLDPPDTEMVSNSEVFGPVICVYSYKDRLEAIARANQYPFSFQASVFTKDIDTAFDTVQRLNATTVMVNDHTAFRVDWMPFGGRMHSGLSMGGIINSMHDMSAEKMMVIQSKVL